MTRPDRLFLPYHAYTYGARTWSNGTNSDSRIIDQPACDPTLNCFFFNHSCRYGLNGCHIQPRNLTFWIDEKTGELEATIALLSQHHHFKSSGLHEELERWDCAVPVRNSSDGSLELTYSRFSGEGTINGTFTANMTNEDILRIDQITIPDLTTPSSTVTTTAITQNSNSNRPMVVDTSIWVC